MYRGFAVPLVAILWVLPLSTTARFDGLAAAQAGAPASRYRTAVAAVELTVTVTRPNGDQVESLAAENFEVRENGRPQAISFFASERVPLDLAILFDMSSSMSRLLPIARDAAKGLLGTLKSDDRIVIFGIGTRFSVLAPLSQDPKVAERGLSEATANGDTALYDAMYVTMRELQASRAPSAEVRRRVIAVLSDGIDTTSLVTFEDAIAAAKASSVAIYTIALPPRLAIGLHGYYDLNGPQARYVMGAFARETGGRAFEVKSPEELSTIYAAISAELAHQYTLAYVPARVDVPEYRSIVVSVPGRPDLRVRHRAGYQVSRGQR